jgi:KUP system potassium uptake protein
MTAAYGFSITIAMLMTTILMYYFLRYVKHFPMFLVVIILIVFLTVESSFFIANAVKIVKRLFFLVFEFGLIFTMYIWYNARKINNRFLTFINLTEYIPLLESLSNDEHVPKFSSHLIYLTKANRPTHIEQKIIYSIFSHNPKKADVYWFIHLERTDEPYTLEYGVEELKSDKVIRIEFRLGFRVQPRVGLMFRKVVEEMVCNKELDIVSRFPSLKKHNIADDFRFVILEKFLSYDNEFSVRDGFILNSYFGIKHLALSDDKAFGLDSSETVVEKLPLIVVPASTISLHRAYYKIHES